jgi:hypothetical protein
LQYNVLSQTHPDYKPQDIEKKHLLYSGGEDIIERASLFITRNQGEHPDAYKARLSCASYVNYMASIIDYFSAHLFSKELSVLPAADDSDPSTPGEMLPDENFYRSFSVDADLSDNSFATVLKQTFRQSMISGVGYLGLDFPNPGIIAETLAQEEALGTSRAYCYQIEEASVINWDIDELGGFNWVVLRKEFPIQESPFSPRDTKKIQFKVWTKEGSVIKWQLFEIICKLNGEPKPKEEIPLVGSGVVSFKEIPVMRFAPPRGLWIGNKIGTLVSDHFKMRSSLFHAQNRSLYAMPFYKQGAEFSGDGDMSVINEDVSRGRKAANVFASRGFAVLGPTDEVGFAEPSGACYQLINEELKEHVDEIFRTVSQMSQSITVTDGGAARSAASKLADNHAMEMLLSEYGHLVRQFAAEVYRCISEARNEDVVWQAHGLSNYEIVDREQLIKEAMAFQENMISIPSMTFKKIHLTKLAQAFAPNISPETQMTIENEIKEWADKNEADIMAMDHPAHEEQVALEQAKATAKAAPPGQGKPVAKAKPKAKPAKK